jgi:hypothetical protein
MTFLSSRKMMVSIKKLIFGTQEYSTVAYMKRHSCIPEDSRLDLKYPHTWYSETTRVTLNKTSIPSSIRVDGFTEKTTFLSFRKTRTGRIFLECNPRLFWRKLMWLLECQPRLMWRKIKPIIECHTQLIFKAGSLLQENPRYFSRAGKGFSECHLRPFWRRGRPFLE